MTQSFMKYLLFISLAASLWAQTPPPAAEGAKPRRAMPEPKNLKILQPGPQLIPIMRSFTASLGVQCNHCHVQGDFASDDKQQKLTARKMLEMTHHINEGFQDGKMHVSCYTCHRGEVTPKTAAPDQGGERRPGPGGPPPAQQPAPPAQ